MSNRPTIHDFVITIMEECGELHTLPFSIVSDTPQIPRWKEVVRCYAITALWENHWTPGSIQWRVRTADGVELPISE